MNRRVVSAPGAETSTDETAPQAYKQAIQSTRDALARRSRCYRALVISVLALLFGSAAIAIFATSWRPLVAIALLFPLCTFFFWLDAQTVANWRRGLLTTWASGRLRLKPIVETIAGIPALPPSTVGAMLATLPDRPSLEVVDRIQGPTRLVVVRAIELLHNESSSRLLNTSIVLSVATVSILGALAQGTQGPLLALAVAPLVAMWNVYARRRRARSLMNQLRDARLGPEESVALARALRTVDISGPAHSRRELLAALQ